MVGTRRLLVLFSSLGLRASALAPPRAGWGHRVPLPFLELALSTASKFKYVYAVHLVLGEHQGKKRTCHCQAACRAD